MHVLQVLCWGTNFGRKRYKEVEIKRLINSRYVFFGTTQSCSDMLPFYRHERNVIQDGTKMVHEPFKTN